MQAWSSTFDIVEEKIEIVYFIQININIALNQPHKGRDKLRFEAAPILQAILR
jgi:hypothetical protein